MSATSLMSFLENAPFSSVPEPAEFGSDLYYVVQKNSGYVVHGSLERVVEEYCGACAYYPYSLDGRAHDEYDQHEHFFGDLLKVVLEHPRSFSIPEEFRSYYSEQQLAIIDAFQQTLLKEHVATQAELAEVFAQRAHYGQYDKAGHPYIYHPAHVAEMTDSDEAQAVAWLHDVVEDTGATLDELREAGFSEAVVAGVDAMTRREGEDYLDFVRRAKANPLAREVKTYDILHNMDLERVVDLDNKVPADALARVRDKYLPALEILMSDDD